MANQERLRTLGEKENCNHLKILEVDTIKQDEEKVKKRESQNNEKALL